MGILNILNKLGCDHDWSYWESYDSRDNNVNTLLSFTVDPKRLRSCYEIRRCRKCTGYETRWVHDWRYDQDSVQARRRYEQEHGDFGTGGPTVMMECSTCGKRDPYYVVMGD